MADKKCFKCGLTKPISEYYIHRQMVDGHLNKCKDCTKSDANKNRQENIDYYRRYDRERDNDPKRIESRRRYISSEKGKAKVRKSHLNYISKFPEKRKAHILVGNKLRDGILKRPLRCESCSVECRPQAHHCDYTKPLDVMWLCTTCHVEWHKINTPIYVKSAA